MYLNLIMGGADVSLFYKGPFHLHRGESSVLHVYKMELGEQVISVSCIFFSLLRCYSMCSLKEIGEVIMPWILISECG